MRLLESGHSGGQVVVTVVPCAVTVVVSIPLTEELNHAPRELREVARVQ